MQCGFPDVRPELCTGDCHVVKHRCSTLLPFDDSAMCGLPFAHQPRTDTGNLTLRIEKRDGNGVQGVTYRRYEGGPHVGEFT